MPPRDASTTTAAATRDRSDQVRGGAGRERDGDGTLLRVAKGEVREDLPDDHGIV